MKFLILTLSLCFSISLFHGCKTQEASGLESLKAIAAEDLAGIPEIKNESKSDPLTTMVIHPAGKSGKNGGRFGCSRICPSGGKKPHRGLDLKAKSDTEFKSLYSGKVIAAIINEKTVPSFGKFLVLQSTLNGKNFYQMYLHLNEIDVKKGEVVTQATILGKTGGTGTHSKGKKAHLHVEIGYGDNYIDFIRDDKNKRYDPEDHISSNLGNNPASHVKNCSC